MITNALAFLKFALFTFPYSQQAQTWKDPVSDVVIFLIEDPPAPIVGFADQIRRVLIAVETYLPQSGPVEFTVRISTNPPRAGPKAHQT